MVPWIIRVSGRQGGPRCYGLDSFLMRSEAFDRVSGG